MTQQTNKQTQQLFIIAAAMPGKQRAVGFVHIDEVGRFYVSKESKGAAFFTRLEATQAAERALAFMGALLLAVDYNGGNEYRPRRSELHNAHYGGLQFRRDGVIAALHLKNKKRRAAGDWRQHCKSGQEWLARCGLAMLLISAAAIDGGALLACAAIAKAAKQQDGKGGFAVWKHDNETKGPVYISAIERPYYYGTGKWSRAARPEVSWSADRACAKLWKTKAAANKAALKHGGQVIFIPAAQDKPASAPACQQQQAQGGFVIRRKETDGERPLSFVSHFNGEYLITDGDLKHAAIYPNAAAADPALAATAKAAQANGRGDVYEVVAYHVAAARVAAREKASKAKTDALNARLARQWHKDRKAGKKSGFNPLGVNWLGALLPLAIIAGAFIDGGAGAFLLAGVIATPRITWHYSFLSGKQQARVETIYGDVFWQKRGGIVKRGVGLDGAYCYYATEAAAQRALAIYKAARLALPRSPGQKVVSDWIRDNGERVIAEAAKARRKAKAASAPACQQQQTQAPATQRRIAAYKHGGGGYYCPQAAAAFYSRALQAAFAIWQQGKAALLCARPVFVYMDGFYYGFAADADALADLGFTLCRRGDLREASFHASRRRHVAAAMDGNEPLYLSAPPAAMAPAMRGGYIQDGGRVMTETGNAPPFADYYFAETKHGFVRMRRYCDRWQVALTINSYILPTRFAARLALAIYNAARRALPANANAAAINDYLATHGERLRLECKAALQAAK